MPGQGAVASAGAAAAVLPALRRRLPAQRVVDVERVLTDVRARRAENTLQTAAASR